MTSWAAAGGATTFTGRYLLRRVLTRRFERNVAALNAGDHRPLLRAYHRDAVVRFADGGHRWAGVHVGRDAIEAFLRGFVDAGLQGEIAETYFGGPPWRMTTVVRFHDRASARGRRGRTVLLVRSRWGRIVEQEDFFENTARIDAFDARLRELGLHR